MYLKRIELSGFKSFAKKSVLEFTSPIAAVVGPNGSGKSNTAEGFRFVLGEQSMKALRGKRGPDLIWSGSDRVPRANRASVSVVFDNKKRFLDIDFEEVALERTVYRDGTNEYAINGSTVRLKDITALLASAHVGASGHHIISQGEADRILGASVHERRAMIEDALGLKAYQYKKAESEKKLEKTNENVKDAKSLRREIAPHLTFLKRQMEKRERREQLAGELKEHYQVYIASEKVRIVHESERIDAALEEPREELRALQATLAHTAPVPDAGAKEKELRERLAGVEQKRREVREEIAQHERALGRIEGQLTLISKEKEPKGAVEKHIPFSLVREEFMVIGTAIEKMLSKGDQTALLAIPERIATFLSQHQEREVSPEPEYADLRAELEEEKASVERVLQVSKEAEEQNLKERTALLTEIEEERSREREAQFEKRERSRELERAIRALGQEEASLEQARVALRDVREEAEHSCGDLALPDISSQSVSLQEQRTRMREIERLSIRLDEAGFVDDDTVREFEETKERDAFLEREIADLEHSQQQLRRVIEQLDMELATRFTEGLERINTEFQTFFAMLFDGGKAELTVVKEAKSDTEDNSEVEEKKGIAIRVHLPRKKITTLDVLSGGERALTSIALIFAMSQVNPPPFIILDETDAALDEANSRKYADMVRALAEHSQLILITHNRQTMEAAGELYGVTMGSDGVSKLLSVKFDEAVQVAK